MRIAIIAATAALGLVAPAQASAPETRTARVRINDLDLADPLALAVLQGRVERAVRIVCSDGVTPDAEAECRAAAAADAAREIERRRQRPLALLDSPRV